MISLVFPLIHHLFYLQGLVWRKTIASIENCFVVQVVLKPFGNNFAFFK